MIFEVPLQLNDFIYFVLFITNRLQKKTITKLLKTLLKLLQRNQLFDYVHISHVCSTQVH